MASYKAFHGTIVHSLSVSEVEWLEDALLVVSPDGKIVGIDRNVARSEISNILVKHKISPSDVQIQLLNYGQFLCPGFVDTHNHAPQWTQRGVGRGIPLLSWLKDVTFAHEARFKDPGYARQTYASCVQGFIRQGITLASYYGSLHGEATKILAETCLQKGQRALVGKCNMDSHAVDFYTETSATDSLSATQDFIAHVHKLDPLGTLVRPILTPRFAISCSHELLTGLGQIALGDPSLMIQTHFNEAPDEIAFTRSLFPQFTNETDLYLHYNLLNDRSILAHAIFNTTYEMTKLADLNVGISHCPISNVTIPTFMAAPIRQFLDRGMLKIGLGTDSGGGFSSSILDAMRQAFIVSNARQTYHSPGKDYTQFRAYPPYPSNADGHHHHHEHHIPPSGSPEPESPLSLAECFYLATLGGARVCNLGDLVGNFLPGKEFDALVINMPLITSSSSPLVTSSSYSDTLNAYQTPDPEPHPSSLYEKIASFASTPIEPDVDDARTIWEKFMMSGDDRNILEVYVRGRRIK